MSYMSLLTPDKVKTASSCFANCCKRERQSSFSIVTSEHCPCLEPSTTRAFCPVNLRPPGFIAPETYGVAGEVIKAPNDERAGRTGVRVSGSAEFTRDPCVTEARYWHAGLPAIDTRSRNQNLSSRFLSPPPLHEPCLSRRSVSFPSEHAAYVIHSALVPEPSGGSQKT